METYYHLTSSDKIESIMKNGLIPCIGDKSEEIRKVQSLIKNTFTKCLYVNCGEWTD